MMGFIGEEIRRQAVAHLHRSHDLGFIRMPVPADPAPSRLIIHRFGDRYPGIPAMHPQMLRPARLSAFDRSPLRRPPMMGGEKGILLQYEPQQIPAVVLTEGFQGSQAIAQGAFIRFPGEEELSRIEEIIPLCPESDKGEPDMLPLIGSQEGGTQDRLLHAASNCPTRSSAKRR